MPYFTDPTETIACPSDPRNAEWEPGAGTPPGYYVTIRTRLTKADRIEAVDAMTDTTLKTDGPTPNVVSKLRLTADEPILLARLITAWNLDDEHGQVLPINVETVKLLSDTDADEIIRRIQALNPRRSREAQKN